jgi:HEPN domain-containing protein
MGHDSLTAKDVRKFVRRAGGTLKVAEQLHVPVEDVIRWAREGLEDEDQAIRLMDLGHFRVCRYGSPPRCTILLPGELDEFIGRLGGLQSAAQLLRVNARTLRRYRKGKFNPPEQVAERIRLALKERPESSRTIDPAVNAPKASDWTEHDARTDLRAMTALGPRVVVPFESGASATVEVRAFQDNNHDGMVLQILLQGSKGAFVPTAATIERGVEIYLGSDAGAASVIKALRGALALL